jgi:hypothetical protein
MCDVVPDVYFSLYANGIIIFSSETQPPPKKRNKKHTNILSPILPVTVETCGILSNAGHYTSLLLLYIHHSLSLSAAAVLL